MISQRFKFSVLLILMLAVFVWCVDVANASANTYFDRGKMFLNEGEWDTAIREFTEAIRLNPNFAEAYGYRARANERQRNDEQALANANQALQLNPHLEIAVTFTARGNVFMNMGDYDRAIADHSEAIRIDPNFEIAFRNRGLVHFRIGDFDRAITDFTEAIRLDSNSAGAHFLRGRTHFHMGDVDRAIADYEAALRIDPNDASVRQNLEIAKQERDSMAASTRPLHDEDFIDLVQTGTAQEIGATIRAGANVNAIGRWGRTALMYAASDNLNSEVITMLINAGADVNARCTNGWTALMYAASDNPNPEVITILINVGADVNARASNGWTALMSAASNSPNPEVISMLINTGADVNARGAVGTTALMSAASNSPNPEVITMFINVGADVNARASNGWTALMYAARDNPNPEVITMLINNGADVNAVNNFGDTALTIGGWNPNHEIVAALAVGADDTIFRRADYFTGITRTDLLRFPDNNQSNKVYFDQHIITQVYEPRLYLARDGNAFRRTSNRDYIIIDNRGNSGANAIVGDTVSVYGVFGGNETLNWTDGRREQVPFIHADLLIFNNLRPDPEDIAQALVASLNAHVASYGQGSQYLSGARVRLLGAVTAHDGIRILRPAQINIPPFTGPRSDGYGISIRWYGNSPENYLISMPRRRQAWHMNTLRNFGIVPEIGKVSLVWITGSIVSVVPDGIFDRTALTLTISIESIKLYE